MDRRDNLLRPKFPSCSAFSDSGGSGCSSKPGQLDLAYILCSQVRLPNEPSHAPNVLTVGRPVAANELVATRDLVVSPHGLVLKEIADGAELVPVFINHLVPFVVVDAEAIDHTTALVLINEDLTDAF